MELKALESLEAEIDYLKTAESLLSEIYHGIGPYELHDILRNARGITGVQAGRLISDLDSHFGFDDSE